MVFCSGVAGTTAKETNLGRQLPAGATGGDEDKDEDEDEDEDEDDNDNDNDKGDDYDNDNDEDNSDGKGEVIRGQHKRKLFIRKTILCI